MWGITYQIHRGNIICPSAVFGDTRCPATANCSRLSWQALHREGNVRHNNILAFSNASTLNVASLTIVKPICRATNEATPTQTGDVNVSAHTSNRFPVYSPNINVIQLELARQSKSRWATLWPGILPIQSNEWKPEITAHLTAELTLTNVPFCTSIINRPDKSILVASFSLEEHANHLSPLFQRLKQYGVMVLFWSARYQFLGIPDLKRGNRYITRQSQNDSF